MPEERLSSWDREAASWPSLGIAFPANAPVELLPDFARRVEESGLRELWVIEDCFLSGGVAMAATALAVTNELRVGIGLVPAPVRNPAIAAMDVATLANLYPGRFTLALGHGVAEWMSQIAALPEKRLTALEEVVTTVRALLAGSTVSTTGAHVQLDGVALERPPSSPPPVLVGTTGPKGLALAGRCADGILLAEGCGPAFVAWALEQAQPSGEKPFECVVYSWLRVEDDLETARTALAPAIEHWLDSGLFPHPVRIAGADAPRQPGFQPGDLADRLAVAGDPPACRAAIERFARAGASRLVFAPVGEDFERQLARLTSDVLLHAAGKAT